MNTEFAAKTNDSLPNYIIETDCGQQWQVALKVINQSLTIMQEIRNRGSEESPILISEIRAEAMEKVLEWCHRHKDDAPFVANRPCIKHHRHSKARPIPLPKWDKTFLGDMNTILLLQVLDATTTLKIPKLMEYTCQIVGKLAMKKTADDIRKLFTDGEEGRDLTQPGPSHSRRM
ncbi:hypothetical protein GCK72_022111 [Caenorhabditis remanei]|uniref:Skp1-related protein n=2 Tax=Caenorhabditis remanei TaxID=31234 RepID=E3MAG7_CAERE|nr:hypothetical protein GCK72_022111 [Caenorhabditis remanei]EFO96690.1 hypothetical protein CRE_17162 [Caenorhabditis remanei]KAF1745664.1 hypothetical protein GCK72_022111 [Caenorhabditis remanei]